MADHALALVHLEQAGAGRGAAGIEHLALKIDLEPADHDAKTRQATCPQGLAHDLPHVRDTGILQELQEGTVVDMAVGVDVGETQMLLGGEAVDPPVRQVEAHGISAP